MARRSPRRSSAPAVAVAIPVKNEEAHVAACLAALDAAAALYPGVVTIVMVANDCADASVARIAGTRLRHARIDWRAVSMLDGARHAGWARRLALDAAAGNLANPRDLLLSTDADTLVAPDWIVRNAAHIAAGADAVAGRALTPRAERAALGEAKRRLDRLGRYYIALDYVRASGEAPGHDPWPRHYYEGGASIATTLGMYRRIGGAPTPPLAEDRALFAAVRAAGGRVRHPVDVRVFTSCRLAGRAPGGMADTLARWLEQDEDAPLHETYGVSAALRGEQREADCLSFRTLPGAIAEAQRLIRALREPPSCPAPEIEPIFFVPLRMDDRDVVPEQRTQLGDGIVPALGIVGLAGPMDEQEVAA